VIARTLRSFLVLAMVLSGAAAAGADALRAVATTPDLADLVREVGGDAVDARSLVKGPQDPHFLEPRPSFVRRLHDADLFVVNGLDLEAGWLPPLLQAARNPRVSPGNPGWLDASTAIRPREVPQDRASTARWATSTRSGTRTT
jgi:zinc/manganese transport system substrate-binding protein